MKKTTPCWCGNNNLETFSSTYRRCAECETLVSSMGLSAEEITVTDDKNDFYGKKYWDVHQKNDLGQPDVYTRSRTDLTERCLHWLRAVLKYKIPPGKALELGCAHGGFVSLLNQAGFDATGLELSPTIVEFALKSFDVPILCGPVEDHDIQASSIDVIALMDVIEHLHDPVSTMRYCINLLSKNGILVIQCPCYQEEMTYEEMVIANSAFLKQLKADEHLYLFSKSSIRKFFNQLGVTELRFEQAIFDQYDMFCVVSLNPLTPISKEDVYQALLGSPKGRILMALLDLANERDGLEIHLSEVEIDRSARLELVKKLEKQLEEVEEDRAERLRVLENLSSHLTEVEKDRSARLELINKLSKQLAEVEEDRVERLRTIENLSKQLAQKK